MNAQVKPAAPPANVVLVLVDDMGFSDIGCYGGEIRTPNIDRLGREGVRLSQFYNTARCSPSRASLLTGLHPHQVGIGVLTQNDWPRGYPGTLNQRCVTLAEVLRDAGYRTCLSGKWHVSNKPREPSDAWPTRRGFDRFFGTLTGGQSYFQPSTLTRGETNVESEALRPDFYYTDAITDDACAFIGEQTQGRPFFLYVAYTAPHWPLHARADDMARYRGAFDEGWDILRERRMQRLLGEGILDDAAGLSDRDPTQPPWESVEHRDWQARRMEAYAAQVDRMDQGVGRIVEALKSSGGFDDTLFLFLSDNGASAEPLPLTGDVESFKQLRPPFTRLKTRDGRDVGIGNVPTVEAGGEDSFASYGRAWANLSNAPFRYYKRWTHEGGIATPLIAHWPHGKLANRTVVRAPAQLVDVMPTILEATGAAYPSNRNGNEILPLEGRSLLPALRGDSLPDATLYWEHTGNAAIRRGRWKLVREYPNAWELYDISRDRSELSNVAAQHPSIVDELAKGWQAWAGRVGVIPWETTIAIYLERGKTAEDAAG
jgi:arylsulfatase